MKKQILPYQLNLSGADSQTSYEDSAKTARWILAQMPPFQHWLDDFRAYIINWGREVPRSDPEYFLELLAFGLAMENYGPDNIRISPFWQKRLAWLGTIRDRTAVKALADLTKGILAGLFIRTTRKTASTHIMGTHPERLLENLAALGDWTGTAWRLRHWAEFAALQTEGERADLSSHLFKLTRQFRKKAHEFLGHYTCQVSQARKAKPFWHRFREDWWFTIRPEVEYHLQMAGAMILNQAYSSDYQSRPAKAAAVPACLCVKGRQCPAIKGELGLTCVHCTPHCPVSRVTSRAAELGAAIWIIPHESTLFQQNSSKGETRHELGIVGVACVLNLLEGGWKVKALGIPAQCVFLEHCGCRKHWGHQGHSAIDEERLISYFKEGGGQSV